MTSTGTPSNDCNALVSSEHIVIIGVFVMYVCLFLCVSDLLCLVAVVMFVCLCVCSGKARGLNFVDKLFRNEAADQRPVVGAFKVRFFVL